MLGLALRAALGGTGGVLLVAGLETWGRHLAGSTLASGQSHDGLPLARAGRPQGGQWLQVAAPADGPGADRAALTGLTLRHGCVWGQPGRNPYRGSTEQALTAAGLPPEVVSQIAAQRQAGQKVGRLTISRDAIRLDDGSREYNPRQMAMSFGNTLCLNTRVNFAPGQIEAADLFEARDAQGQMHAVMVPDACNNVTVLGTPRAGGVVAGVSAALLNRALALSAVADALAQAPADTGARAGVAGALDALDATAPAEQVPAEAGAGNGRLAPEGLAGPQQSPDQRVQPGGDAGTLVGSLGGVGGSAGGSTPGGGAALPRGELAIVWPDPGGSWLPRTPVIVGFKASADLLARAAATISSLAVPGGEPGPASPSTRSAESDRQRVPEPGTLLCVLAALAGLVWVGRHKG